MKKLLVFVLSGICGRKGDPLALHSDTSDGVGDGGNSSGGVCEYLLQTYSSPRKFLAGI